MGVVAFLLFMIFVLIVGLMIFIAGLAGCIVIKIYKRKKSKPAKKVFNIISIVCIVLGILIMSIPVSFGCFIVYVNYENTQYTKTIEYAADEMNYDKVLALLENGTDPDECSGSYTPLMHICTVFDASPDGYKIAKLLIQYGADVNARYAGYDDGSEIGYTALFYAVTDNEKANLVQLLIDSKADVNHRAADGKTPLIIAREMSIYGNSGNKEIIEILIDNGASE